MIVPRTCVRLWRIRAALRGSMGVISAVLTLSFPTLTSYFLESFLSVPLLTSR